MRSEDELYTQVLPVNCCACCSLETKKKEWPMNTLLRQRSPLFYSS